MQDILLNAEQIFRVWSKEMPNIASQNEKFIQDQWEIRMNHNVDVPCTADLYRYSIVHPAKVAIFNK